MTTLGGAEFAPETTYLNTSTAGLLPRSSVEAVRDLAAKSATGSYDGSDGYESVESARASFARIAGVDPSRVALGGSVAAHVALVAASLPAGAEVLFPEGEFSSVITPFTIRGDLKLRYVPLDALAQSVRPGTALVAFSVVQSVDGRLADTASILAAASAHGARTLADLSQAAGWLPLDAGAFDYTVTGGFKFLLSPRGVSFLTVTEEAQGLLPPLYAGWVAAESPWDSTYGPVERLASTARRLDAPPSFLAYHAAARSLALLEATGIETIHAHAVGLASLFREGAAGLGFSPVGAGAGGASAVVAVRGLGERQLSLREAGVVVAARGGNLRVAFHLYNASADVGRVLEALAPR
ncbi:aminotransferase class V-fold PLP-dependent enzyme [Streptomyces sp. NPDC088261]|uniref:aminotransferase class V-fold PLP-dependent enzyme n=1 Tax=Streptomyces sp. NPDC088261 TaxID=3365851 RepID=UPI0038104181